MRRLAMLLGIVVVLAVPASASANIHGYPNFAGTCSFAGEHGAGTTLAAQAQGTCTGLLAHGSSGSRGSWPVRLSLTAQGADACVVATRPGGTLLVEFLDEQGDVLTTSDGHLLYLDVAADLAAVGADALASLTGGRPSRYASNTRGRARLVYDSPAPCLAGTSRTFSGTLDTGPSLRRSGNLVVPDNVLVSRRQT